jgi:hypothetical protein
MRSRCDLAPPKPLPRTRMGAATARRGEPNLIDSAPTPISRYSVNSINKTSVSIAWQSDQAGIRMDEALRSGKDKINDQCCFLCRRRACGHGCRV